MATKKKKSTVSKVEKVEKPVIASKIEVPVGKESVVQSPEDIKAEAKAEVLEEMVGTGEIQEVRFVKSKVPRSEYFADLYNARPKVIATWATEDGEMAGTAEPVKMNGAVAWIPKGVSVLVPDVVAKSFKRYIKITGSVGEDIPNMRGGMGIGIGKDDKDLKQALNL